MSVKLNPAALTTLFASLILIFINPASSFPQSKKTGTPTQTTIQVESRKTGKFENEDIDESSGVIASRNHRDKFWTHNDNGDDLRLFLIDDTGKVYAIVKLAQIKARDIEDISEYEIDGKSHIVLGDIGDNAFRRETCGLLVFEEPELKLDRGKVVRAKIDEIVRIEFAYEDGSRNCEAMAVDSHNKEVWLATKESLAVRFSPGKRNPAFYRLSIADTNTKQKEPLVARKIEPLPDPLVTGMDFSHDNSMAVIRTYTYARLYRRDSKQSWEEVFGNGDSEMFALPTQIQGEAICFFEDDAALLTTSEQKRQPIWRIHLPTPDSK